MKFVEYCYEQIPTKPRVALINTKEKLYKEKADFDTYCKSVHCATCRFYKNYAAGATSACFTEWLAEEVEE